MKYTIIEINSEDGARYTAGVKAREDIENIVTMNGYTPIEVRVGHYNRKECGLIKKVIIHKSIMKEWKRKTDHLKEEDELLIQFPVLNHSLFLYQAIKMLRKRNVKITLLIHDLDTFRVALREDYTLKNRLRLKFEEQSLLDLGNKIIVHNKSMMFKLIQMGYSQYNMSVLGIFDYLIPNYEEKYKWNGFSKNKPIIIAGALRYHKAKYIYDLPENIKFNLYGIGYKSQNKSNINYFGAFQPDVLPFILSGSFGLVWDGESRFTCNGIYGKYLTINNPHKTSLYLASGIPVIIWENAALAEFVEKNRCGITIKSLDDIENKLSLMSEKEYQMLKVNAEFIGKRLRSGYYTTCALK